MWRGKQLIQNCLYVQRVRGIERERGGYFYYKGMWGQLRVTVSYGFMQLVKEQSILAQESKRSHLFLFLLISIPMRQSHMKDHHSSPHRSLFRSQSELGFPPPLFTLLSSPTIPNRLFCPPPRTPPPVTYLQYIKMLCTLIYNYVELTH